MILHDVKEQLMGRQSVEQIISTTLNSIVEADELYYKMSGGEWLWNAPEYFVTSKIAENIFKDGSIYVTLEDNVEYVLINSNARGRGQISGETRKDGRADIVLWWKSVGTARAVIEVKNGIYGFTSVVEADIKRICALMGRRKESSLKFGLFAFYISRRYKEDAGSKLSHQIDRLFEGAKRVLEKRQGLSISKYLQEGGVMATEDDKDACCAVVFLIKRA